MEDLDAGDVHMDMITNLGNEVQMQMKTNQYTEDYISIRRQGVLDQNYRREKESKTIQNVGKKKRA